MTGGRERRRYTRVKGSGMRARARPGHVLMVIDISSCGALVEAPRALRPGAHLEMQLETTTPGATLRARVVRCEVAALDADGITYRAGLAFSENGEAIREATTLAGNGMP
jgi:PilZ domain-containing protein